MRDVQYVFVVACNTKFQDNYLTSLIGLKTVALFSLTSAKYENHHTLTINREITGGIALITVSLSLT